MADDLIKKFLDEAGGQELAKQVKTLIAAKASPEDITNALKSYSNTEAVNGLIQAAIAASEKKIFGDGELAEAFDTIKEIGDYLKDHDNVAKAINEAIAKKLDKTEAEETYQKKADMGEYAKTSEVEDMLEDYATSDDLEECVKAENIQAIPVTTVRGWFN